MTLSRKKILAFGLITFVLTTGLIIYLNIASKSNVIINTKNIASAEVFATDSGLNINKIKDVDLSSGTGTIRLEKNTEYTIEYKAQEGFANGEVSINPKGDSVSVNIDPYLSSEKLSELLKADQKLIIDSLNKEMPNIKSLYKIESQSLHNFGEWYIARLKYTGNDLFNADSLVLIMNKNDEKWTLVTKPPAISVSYQEFEDVPENIIDIANQKQTSVLIDLLGE